MDPELHLKYLIELALSQKVSWLTLKPFLHELATTFEASKQLNVILLEELQILHSKIVANQKQETNDDIDGEVQETVENGSEENGNQ